MLLIRLAEEELARSVEAGEIRCPVHLYTGQEAVATGVCLQLEQKDFVFGTHRSHGHFLAKGGDLKAMIAEIYGRSTGCARGRGGSMHVIDPERHIYATPIVGATIPHAVGAALAAVRQGTGAVAVAFFGDGAVEEGRFCESLGLAALYQLPVLFVCENNLYASHMPLAARRRNPDIYRLGEAFGLPGVRVDGNDVCAVYLAAQDALQRARRGDGPTLLECLTYRWRGHVGPNYDLDKGLRSPEELAAWQARCPIRRLGQRLVEQGIQNQAQLDTIQQQVAGEVEQAWSFARTSPPPDPNELLDFVWADPL